MFNLAQLREERREKGEGGFTLIELLVVVVIIGILIAIAIPLYLNYKKGANDKSAQSDLRNVVSTVEQCTSDNNGTLPSAIDSTGAITGCSTGTINLSSGTTMKYATVTNGYYVASTNTNGSGKFYCYNSTVGGSVKALATAPANIGAASC